MPVTNREVTADAAQWLWQNREGASVYWLRQTEARSLVNICLYAQAFDTGKRAVPKLHTMASVMEAFHAAGPSQYLVGTSNWCNAIAQELNK